MTRYVVRCKIEGRWRYTSANGWTANFEKAEVFRTRHYAARRLAELPNCEKWYMAGARVVPVGFGRAARLVALTAARVVDSSVI